jgi:hypothetical protein
MVKVIEISQEIHDVQYETKSSWNPTVDSKILCYLSDRIDGNILEVGCNRGGTCYMLAVRNKERVVIGIDNSGERTMWPYQQWEQPKAEDIGIDSKHLPNVIIYDHNSRTFDYEDLGGVTFIFIDGDHTYEGVKADTEKALEYLKKRYGGVIVWHDYKTDEWGVKKYVEELAENMEIYHFAGSWIAYTRIEKE